MADAIFQVFRGNREGGQPALYRVPIAPGMVVLDALHHIQAHQATLRVPKDSVVLDGESRKPQDHRP